MNRKIIIGSRGSKLALLYAQKAKDKIIEALNLPDDQIIIQTITTKGDQIQDRRLSEVGGKGLFSSTIEKELKEKKSHFEILFSTIIKIDEQVKEKKDLEKIVLCDVQTEIYPDLEKSLLDLLHNSGYPGIKFEKKIDFENLYNQRFN